MLFSNRGRAGSFAFFWTKLGSEVGGDSWEVGGYGDFWMMRGSLGDEGG